MRNFRIYFFSLLFLFFINPGRTFGQEQSLNISLEAPDEIRLEKEVMVTIELTDQDGQGVPGLQPEVTFSPQSSVQTVDLFDCSDPFASGGFDSCNVNHRGVDGLFESIFILKDSPVTLTVAAAEKEETLRLVAKPVSLPSSPSKITSAAITPSAIRVGPYPSFWLLSIPLLVMSAVVAYFVVKTVD